MNITKEKFAAYLSVRASGVTNMCMVTDVCLFSGLDKDEVKYIMVHYRELKEQFKE